MKDLITCSKCMRVVERGHICPYRTQKQYVKSSPASKFRNTKSWMKKSKEIKERDNYLCRAFINNLYSTVATYNFKKLEVHHIIPIEEDYNKRLDNDNLITLCSYHHHMAELGLIPREELFNIIPPM